MNEAKLPEYVCHKHVWALKIKAIEFHKPPIEQLGRVYKGNASAATITPEESEYAPFEVSGDYITKHDPRVGGYYVVYEDGYKSFSPAKAFEQGYTKL